MKMQNRLKLYIVIRSAFIIISITFGIFFERAMADSRVISYLVLLVMCLIVARLSVSIRGNYKELSELKIGEQVGPLRN